MKWLDAIIDMGLAAGTLETSDVDLIRGCFATRGRRKGLLLASAPSASNDPMRAAAWQGLMGNLAPARLGVATLMFMPSDAKTVFRRIDAWASDRAVRSALNSYAQGMCEFNLYHLNNDPIPADRFARNVQAAIDAFLAKRAYA